MKPCRIKKETTPKYRQVMDLMRTAIREGQYPARSLFPGEHEWAARCGVSRQTVRQAMGALERDGYLIRQQGKGTFVRFPPSPQGSRSRAEAAEIGVLLPCVTIAIYPEILRGVEDVCGAAGFHVIIGNYDVIPKKEQQYLASMIAKPVAGLVVCPSYNSAQSSYHRLLDRDIPFVLVDLAVDGIDADLVATNNYSGAREGTQALLARGCRKLAFLSGYRSASTSRDRLAGFRAALEEHGLTPDPSMILEGAYAESFGYEAVQRLLAAGRKIDGLFIANDPITGGAIRAILEAGLRIPEDVRLCTFDEPDVPLMNRVPLIRVEQPRLALGKVAAETLLARMAEKKSGAARRPPHTIRLDAEVVSPSGSAISRPSAAIRYQAVT